MEYSDEQIREMAKKAGFWKRDIIYWYDAIPRLRRFLELATRATETDRECECYSPLYLLGPCLNCGGRPRVGG